MLPNPKSGLTVSKLLVLSIAIVAFCAESMAQDTPPSDVVPPPLSRLSKKTIKQLDGVKSLGSRTKLVINLMESEVVASAEEATEKDYQAALDRMGKFRGLMFHHKDALLDRRGRKPSFRNNKRFEIALRKFVPSLEKIRRDLPFRYGYHIKRLIKDLQDVREDLQDSFFGSVAVNNK